MKKQNITWLASYPRSGNTLLRTILWHCFGQQTGSVYPNDLGGNSNLEKKVGHIEHSTTGQIRFPEGNLHLVKTHEHPPDNNPSVYIVRDGRAAAVSMWRFYQKKGPLSAIITGKHRFGTWASHIAAWKPWERKNTLLLKYETMINDQPLILKELSRFLKRDIISHKIPERDNLASIEGKWIRKKTSWQESMNKNELELFNNLNEEMMAKMGYE